MISEDSSSCASLAIKLAVSLDTKTTSAEFVSHINKTDYIFQVLVSIFINFSNHFYFPKESVALKEKSQSFFLLSVAVSYQSLRVDFILLEGN